jgi:hypothetical protein
VTYEQRRLYNGEYVNVMAFIISKEGGYKNAQIGKDEETMLYNLDPGHDATAGDWEWVCGVGRIGNLEAQCEGLVVFLL